MKDLLLRVSNAGLYLLTCVLVATGLLLELRLDDEDGPARILGMNQDDWAEFHFAIALVFAAAVLIHMALNWSWIKMIVSKQRFAAAVLIAGIVLGGGLLLMPAYDTGDHSHGKKERVCKDDD